VYSGLINVVLIIVQLRLILALLYLNAKLKRSSLHLITEGFLARASALAQGAVDIN